jgi:hypothetical protein
MAEKKSLIDKIQDLDPKVIYTILLISLLIPYIRPLGLPIPISPETRAYWNYITSLPPGSVVAVQLASDPSTIPQTRSSHQITILKLFEQGCKLFFFTLRDDAPPLHEEMMRWVEAHLSAGKTITYGVDYVNIGYVADAEATIASLVADVKGLVDQDAYGNPLSSLPMMADINTGEDFDLVVWNDGSRGIYMFALRQWREKLGTPLVIIAATINKPGIMNYIQSGQVSGGAFGVDGGAQIETISGYLGDAKKATEPGSLSALTLTILLLVSNTIYISKRFGNPSGVKGGEVK